jgi:exonuclease VII small subunit
MAQKQPRDPAEMTYEEAQSELEEIIRRIDAAQDDPADGSGAGGMGLEAMLAARRRGMALVERCRTILDRAESELTEDAAGTEAG